MIEFILYICVCTVIQVGILRIWMDSYIFRHVQSFLRKHREDKTPMGMLCYLCQCWQCFGIWMGWCVCFLTSAFLPSSPICVRNIPCILMSGVAVGFLSECVEAFIVSKLSTPYFQEEADGEEETEEDLEETGLDSREG